ncbi:hypothetical protein Hanom_Chr09g00796611 [Helianthus anomalus]
MNIPNVLRKLEKIVTEKTAESKASEILAKEVSADCKWLLARGVPLIVDRIVKSDELANYMFELGGVAYNSGRKDGYGEGRAAVATSEKDYHFDLYKEDCTTAYTDKRREYEFLEFAIVKAVGKLSRKTDAVETLKKALGEQDVETGDAGPSHQVSRMNDGYDRLLLLWFDDPAVRLSFPALEVYNVYFTLSTMFSRISGHEVIVGWQILIVYI